jgi:predicted  nucleic acid-binding Zn-ribbon protein
MVVLEGTPLAATRPTEPTAPTTLPTMTQPNDLVARVAALETKVDRLADRVRHNEQDAAAARVLAGGADRDVAEIRAEIREFREQNTRVLNAMREDLTDLRQRVNNLEQRVSNLEQQVSNGFAEMRGKFDATAAGLQQITDLLNTLIAQEPQNDQCDRNL